MDEQFEGFFRYLPISQRTASWGLYVTGCGHVCVPRSGEHPPRGHPELYRFRWERGRVLPEYQLIYLTGGEGVFESAAAGMRKIAAGDLIVLFPGVWHRYRPARRSAWETLWISLDGEYVQRLVEQGFLSAEQPVLAVGQNRGLVEAYHRLLATVRDQEESNPLLLAARAMEILAWILAPPQPEIPQPATAPFAKPLSDRLVAEAVRFIWSHSRPELTVVDVAAHFPVTRRSLERRFHRLLGHTILDEIVRCRLERARRLLLETDLPLKAVALSAGFSSGDRMSKVFRRAQGLSPAEYRRRQASSTHPEKG